MTPEVCTWTDPYAGECWAWRETLPYIVWSASAFGVYVSGGSDELPLKASYAGAYRRGCPHCLALRKHRELARARGLEPRV